MYVTALLALLVLVPSVRAESKLRGVRVSRREHNSSGRGNSSAYWQRRPNSMDMVSRSGTRVRVGGKKGGSKGGDFDFDHIDGLCQICTRDFKNKPISITIEYASQGRDSMFQDSSKASCAQGVYPSRTRISIENKDRIKQVFFDIHDGSVFTIQGPFDANLEFEVDGAPDCTIHTSCSVPLYSGDQIGPFKILGGTGELRGTCEIPSESPSMALSPSPSIIPSEPPTPTPSKIPSREPTPFPVLPPVEEIQTFPPTTPKPSSQPSSPPTPTPSAQPISPPSTQPSTQPSAQPSTQPSAQPSTQPSTKPSPQPSTQPSTQPNPQPSPSPSRKPSELSTPYPSGGPSNPPSAISSSPPSLEPSSTPSTTTSAEPTPSPSTYPSAHPSSPPSMAPSSVPPSLPPSTKPTFATRCPPTEVDSEIIFQDFEDGSAIGWANVIQKIDGTQPGYSVYLGPFSQTDPMPFRSYQIPNLSTTRVFFQFDFIEIDSWDGNSISFGMDTFGIQVTGNGNSDTVSFGHFNANNDELTGRGASSMGIVWSMTSIPASESGQGGGSDLSAGVTDQRHSFVVEVPKTFFGGTSREVTLTMFWTLKGDEDEFVGIDNVRAVGCLDTIPSVAPSESPSMMPTASPVEAPRPRPNPRPTFPPVDSG